MDWMKLFANFFGYFFHWWLLLPAPYSGTWWMIRTTVIHTHRFTWMCKNESHADTKVSNRDLLLWRASLELLTLPNSIRIDPGPISVTVRPFIRQLILLSLTVYFFSSGISKWCWNCCGCTSRRTRVPRTRYPGGFRLDGTREQRTLSDRDTTNTLRVGSRSRIWPNQTGRWRMNDSIIPDKNERARETGPHSADA